MDLFFISLLDKSTVFIGFFFISLLDEDSNGHANTWQSTVYGKLSWWSSFLEINKLWKSFELWKWSSGVVSFDVWWVNVGYAAGVRVMWAHTLWIRVHICIRWPRIKHDTTPLVSAQTRTSANCHIANTHLHTTATSRGNVAAPVTIFSGANSTVLLSFRNNQQDQMAHGFVMYHNYTTDIYFNRLVCTLFYLFYYNSFFKKHSIMYVTIIWKTQQKYCTISSHKDLYMFFF